MQLKQFYNIATKVRCRKVLLLLVIYLTDNASNYTAVDALLKFRLLQYDTFYDGRIQQESSECLMVPIEVINKG